MDILEGWLAEITGWFKDAFLWVWDGYVLFMKALFLMWLRASLDAVAYLFHQVPVPGFLAAYGLGDLLAATGPTVQWLVSEFRIAEGLAVISAGYTFRIIRKFSTAFQW